LGKFKIKEKMTKLMLISFFMLVVANVLVAQSSFTVTLGTNREYHIDAQPSISNYLWEVYNDANLTVLTSSADVTLASLGVGREHEIEVTWNTLGTYYLTISVTDTSCTNKMACQRYELYHRNCGG
jgi:hypothetical protein